MPNITAKTLGAIIQVPLGDDWFAYARTTHDSGFWFYKLLSHGRLEAEQVRGRPGLLSANAPLNSIPSAIDAASTPCLAHRVCEIAQQLPAEARRRHRSGGAIVAAQIAGNPALSADSAASLHSAARQVP